MEKRYRGETAIFDIDIGCQEGGRDRGDNMLSERGVSVGGATECLLDGTSPPPPGVSSATKEALWCAIDAYVALDE